MFKSVLRAVVPVVQRRLTTAGGFATWAQKRCIVQRQPTRFGVGGRTISSRSTPTAAAAARLFSDAATASQLHEARLGIREGMTNFGAGNFAAAEAIFRTVLERLQTASTAHSREHKIFQAATRLNLANAIREQYRVRACSGRRKWMTDCMASVVLFASCIVCTLPAKRCMYLVSRGHSTHNRRSVDRPSRTRRNSQRLMGCTNKRPSRFVPCTVNTTCGCLRHCASGHCCCRYVRM